jgi:hypothetical protein
VHNRSCETRGAPIPGSVYVRDFCAGCGEPIRVSAQRLRGTGRVSLPNYCDVCGERPMGPPPRCGPEDETTPEWENMIRALEDGTN